MADIENLLKQRASDLAPTDGQRQAAARSHTYLRDTLATGKMECRIQADYLSGSYARQTAIRPLDDVDVVFEIDPSYWRRDFFRRLLDQLPPPVAVLDTFARAIRYRYSNSRVQRQRRSVGLVMEHLHVDVVPAVADEDKPMWLRIPDVVDGRWIVTAPKVHSEIAIALNSKTDGLFKPLVRILKGWNAGLPETVRFRSFAVETLAGRLFSACRPSSLTEGATYFFDFVSWRGGHGSNLRWTDSCGVELGGWSGSVPDLAGTGSNLVGGYDGDRRAKFTAAARVARDAFLRAIAARNQDVAWNQVEPRLRAGMERL
jgi:hypothetical protein